MNLYYIDLFQEIMYIPLNVCSKPNNIQGILGGRLGGAIIVVPLDVAVETFKTPLLAIENIAKVPINLFGAMHKEKYSIKNAIKHAEEAISFGLRIPISLAMAPIKLGFQEIAMLIKPANVNSIHYFNSQKNKEPTFNAPTHTERLEKENSTDTEEENNNKGEEVDRFLNKKLTSQYAKLNDFSSNDWFLGRLYAISVTLLDVMAETSKAPLLMIEHLFKAAIHFSLAAFPINGDYTFKNALYHAEHTVVALLRTPLSIGMAPVKMIFQIGAGLIHPSRVRPFHEEQTFKSKTKNEIKCIVVAGLMVPIEHLTD